MNRTADFLIPRYPVRLVAAQTGLSPHVLRAWERRYRVVTPTRSEGGQRLYSDADIDHLRRLRRLIDRGHAIGRIASLPLEALTRLDQETGGAGQAAAPPRRSVGPPDAGLRAEMVRHFAAEALRATRRLDSTELQAVLERAAVSLGVPAFLEGVVAPALEDIGHGWAEHSVSVAQEHMATAVFRRVLNWLLGVYEVKGSAPRLVAATPPGEVHEMGALMVAVSAAAEGWGVTYLGPDLPVEDLLRAADQIDARAVAVSVVHVSDANAVVDAVRQTRAGLPEGVPLLVGGAATPEIRPKVEGAGVWLIDSLQGLRELLQRLGTEEVELGARGTSLRAL